MVIVHKGATPGISTIIDPSTVPPTMNRETRRRLMRMSGLFKKHGRKC